MTDSEKTASEIIADSEQAARRAHPGDDPESSRCSLAFQVGYLQGCVGNLVAVRERLIGMLERAHLRLTALESAISRVENEDLIRNAASEYETQLASDTTVPAP